ncbi:MAG TPA: hypothetical protein VGN06_13485 [Gaiellaceae bacterium]
MAGVVRRADLIGVAATTTAGRLLPPAIAPIRGGPWWLKLLLALKIPQARALDEERHTRYLDETRYLVDE